MVVYRFSICWNVLLNYCGQFIVALVGGIYSAYLNYLCILFDIFSSITRVGTLLATKTDRK